MNYKSENQQLFNEVRHMYVVENKISYTEYLKKVSDIMEIPPNKIPFTCERIKNAYKSDNHLNNISLLEWDEFHSYFSDVAINKKISWSLSDTVSLAKYLAKVKAEIL